MEPNAKESASLSVFPFTLSALVTREEYSDAAAQQKRQQRRPLARFFLVVGAVLVVFGLGGLFFGSYIRLAPSAALCSLLLGLFLVLYDGVVAPLIDKGAAAREYDQREDLRFAAVYTFDSETVTLRNGRITGTVPLSLFTGWSETPALFILEAGMELTVAVPKRMMTEEQCAALLQLLRERS